MINIIIYVNCKIGVPDITLNAISKVFNNLRKQIKINIHLNWKKSYFGDTGFPSIEIDESKIINNGNTVYWMFDLYVPKPKKLAYFAFLIKDKEKIICLTSKKMFLQMKVKKIIYQNQIAQRQYFLII